MVLAIEATAPAVPPGVWKVWNRPRGVKRWRLVGTAPTKALAVKLMHGIMTDLSQDWYTSPPGGDSPNVRRACWRS